MKETFKVIADNLTILEVKGERITIANIDCFVTEELLPINDIVHYTIHHLNSGLKVSFGFDFPAAFRRAETILSRETQEISTRAFYAYTQVMALNK